MKRLNKILFLLGPNDKKRAIFLLFIILILAIIEMIGVVSIMPLMAVLMNPEMVNSNIYLNSIFKISGIFGVETVFQFLIFLSALFFFILTFSLSLKIFTTYYTNWVVNLCNYNISKKLLDGYLNQPYIWFLNRHSADLSKTILSEIIAVVKQGLNPTLILIKQSLITLLLITVLILVNLKLTLIIGFTFGLFYGIIFLTTRGYIKKLGKERLDSNRILFTTISEAFGGVKEVKINGLEDIYVNKFSSPAKKIVKIQTLFGFLNLIPRFALEFIVFGGLLLVVLYLMISYGSIDEAFPIISLFAYTCYRIMPALQGIFTSITQIRFVGPSLDALYLELKNLKTYKSDLTKSNLMKFKNVINLKNINFNYPNAKNFAVKNLNFDIKLGEKVGIIGTTGSGKTTVMDIILGLIEPQNGTLKVDNTVIDRNNLRAWQSLIGYVPQTIFLTDDTIAGNIALGVDTELIDMDMVEKAAKIANLHEFITNELSEKYLTTVGERGIRLSGGQRQRIGIARALYHKPKILFLDEATSALDNITEKKVMDRLFNSNKDMTIIMIAHRLSTVRVCDNILLLEKGEIKAQGKFEDLIKEN